MIKKSYTTPEVDIEKFYLSSQVMTLSDYYPDDKGGLDEGDNVIDF